MVVVISCKRIGKAIEVKRDTKENEKNVILDKKIYLFIYFKFYLRF